jgi:hypothetical protein
MASILAYTAAALTGLWGVAHAVPTRQVLAGVAPITRDNRRVLLQEWLAEAVTMWGVAVLLIVVTVVGGDATVTAWVYRITAGLLLGLAVLTSPDRCQDTNHLVQDLSGVVSGVDCAADRGKPPVGRRFEVTILGRGNAGGRWSAMQGAGDYLPIRTIASGAPS